ncbi:MAG: SH3 domain-containing protein [Planctomycetaceae bacterium]|jgi:SH3-like domain-containing protein|nr:SH3 domain-containing protein [Planctomycetaceae bacterium]
MRYVLFLGLSVSALTGSLLAEPYVAVITADSADVRSGPGEQFYTTSQLKSGDSVEVHQENGDWLAVRPPVGNFSWIGGQFVRCGTGNIGTVLTDGLASRIGSTFSDDCSTVQVRLNKGEAVFIIERRETPENPACPVWLKIAPPNGEFRWIARSAVSGGFRNDIVQARYDAVKNDAALVPPQPVRDQKVVSTASVLPAPAALAAPFAAGRSFQEKLTALQTDVNAVMKKPAADEVFAALIRRAEELHQTAKTDNELEQTYHILESLKRTRNVRKELFLLPALINPLKPSGVLTGKANRSEVPQVSPPLPLRAGENVGGYDIVGKIGGFEPLPKGHPPFAVVNEKNEIICMITPVSQLDLEPYVGQFVGINGRLGFYEKPGKPASRHITAENIQIVR